MNILKTKLLSLFILAFLASSCANRTIPENELDQFIKDATDFMLESTLPSGQFIYRINMNPDVTVNPSYNMLRHAGATFALTMSYDYSPNDQILSAMLSSTSFLIDSTVGPIPDTTGILTVWSIPSIVGSNKVFQSKLGGAGLGLISLASTERIQPGSIPNEVMTGLGNYILYSQKEDGSYYSKYIPGRGGLNDEWTSLYYPGEAALGLMLLFELDGNKKWVTSAAKTIEYLADSRKGDLDVPADHWALMASEKLMELPPDECPIPQDIIVDHAIQVCKSILKSQVMESDNPDFIGGFADDGRTTPTATRLEGLLAAQMFIPDSHPIQRDIQFAIHEGIRFLLNNRISGGFYKGGMPRAAGYKDESESGAKKFNRRVTEIRIDYVQHALSAVIRYKEQR